MTVKEIIDLFKDKPMDFAPGEKWSYSNSGYILLGAIIEKVSGMSYEDFLQKNIFDVVGMKSSYYGNAGRIIAHRIPGYSKGKTGLENAAYLSMTQPYAAGSLLSTVGRSGAVGRRVVYRQARKAGNAEARFHAVQAEQRSRNRLRIRVDDGGLRRPPDD
jgi:CubicO group peptidase (beta-lactamase class C family)